MAFTLRVVSLLVFAMSVSAQEPNCARNYTVQAGDVCDSISAAQNVSTFQLARVNVDKIDANCDNLFVGEALCLGITGQDCTTNAVVQTGDTCATIASTAGITTALLLQNNPNVSPACVNIFPGEVLCTANQVIPYTT